MSLEPERPYTLASMLLCLLLCTLAVLAVYATQSWLLAGLLLFYGFVVLEQERN